MTLFDFEINPVAGTGWRTGPDYDVRDRRTGISRQARIDPGDPIGPMARPLGQVLAELRGSYETVPNCDEKLLTMFGRYLAGLLWPNDDAPADWGKELRIVTRDPLVAALPWPLLRPRDGSISFGGRGLPVSVCLDVQDRVTGLPKPCRILIAAPNPNTGGWPDTGGPAHFSRMRDALGRASPRPVPSAAGAPTPDAHDIHQVCVTRYDELCDAMAHLSPHILYFYGHGVVTDETLDLLFEDGAGGLDRRSVVAFADFLERYREASKCLQLVYLNCCWGGTTELWGGPMSLAKIVPALISNRMSALVTAAQLQAEEILRRIVHAGVPPAEAVAQIVSDGQFREAWSRGITASRSDPWWIAPVAFTGYSRWSGASAPLDGNLAVPRDAVLRLDRSHAWGEVHTPLQENMAGQPTWRILVVVWGGRADDGLRAFGERLELELASRNDIYCRRIGIGELSWPSGGASDQASRRELLGRNLRSQLLENENATDGQLAGHIGRVLTAGGGRFSLGLMLHEPMGRDRGTDEIVGLVGAYVSYLSKRLSVAIGSESDGTAKPFLLVGIPLESDDWPTLCAALDRTAQNSWPQTDVRLLPQFGAVTANDVVNVLKRSTIREIEERQRIASDIIAQTQGRYVPTSAALLNLDADTF